MELTKNDIQIILKLPLQKRIKDTDPTRPAQTAEFKAIRKTGKFIYDNMAAIKTAMIKDRIAKSIKLGIEHTEKTQVIFIGYVAQTDIPKLAALEAKGQLKIITVEKRPEIIKKFTAQTITTAEIELETLKLAAIEAAEPKTITKG